MPDCLDTLCGHDNVKAQLRTVLKTGRIGHAYIFAGPTGVGRYTAALSFAREIVGTKAKEHPDIITVTNELYDVSGKTDTILAETVSSMRKDVYIRPYDGGRKVYIMPKADTMNAAAQNKLLKVFEEPPEYCTIIFIAVNRNKLLPTILSRATLIRFSSLPCETVADYLISRLGIDSAEAAQLSVMSEGSIGAAVGMAGNSEPRELRRRIVTAFMSLMGGENRAVFDLARLISGEKDNIDLIFSIFRSLFEDLIRLKYGFGRVNNTDLKDELGRLKSAASQQAAAELLDITIKYERIYKTNVNLRIMAFCMACEYREELNGRNYRSTV